MEIKDPFIIGLTVIVTFLLIAAITLAVDLADPPINADPIQATYPNETKLAPTNVMYLEIDNKPVARLWYDGNVLKFEGNVDAGAKVFFEYMMEYVDFACMDLCGPGSQEPVPWVH